MPKAQPKLRVLIVIDNTITYIGGKIWEAPPGNYFHQDDVVRMTRERSNQRHDGSPDLALNKLAADFEAL